MCEPKIAGTFTSARAGEARPGQKRQQRQASPRPLRFANTLASRIMNSPHLQSQFIPDSPISMPATVSLIVAFAAHESSSGTTLALVTSASVKPSSRPSWG